MQILKGIPILFTLMAIAAFSVGMASPASASSSVSNHCENDKCMFFAWCQDGSLFTSCDMNNPLQGGCITRGCSVE